MKKCAKCGFEYDDAYDGCPQCARALEARPAATIGSVDAPMLLGLAGAALLFIGAFLPIVSLPAVGSVNYFNNGQGDGTILIALALISALLVLIKRYKFLLVTGGLSLVLLGYTFFALNARIADAKAALEAQLAGNPFIGIAQAAMQSVQMQWGWAVLVLGAVLLLAAWFMDSKRIAPSQTAVAPTAGVA